MQSILQALRGDHRQLLVVGALSFTTITCAALLCLRAAYSHTLGHFGLAWNLILAWLPLVSALAAYNLGKGQAHADRSPRNAEVPASDRPGQRKVTGSHAMYSDRLPRWTWPLILICAGLWLLFFPNAPYILTDLIHLREQDGVPLWYDLILIINFAWTGTFLGLVSLALMQALVRKAAGGRLSWLFVLAVLALCGFGIYLGRFPRWNSWDLLVNPAGLLADVWERVRHPLADPRAVVFSGLFSLLLTSIYITAVAFAQLVPRPESAWGLRSAPYDARSGAGPHTEDH